MKSFCGTCGTSIGYVDDDLPNDVCWLHARTGWVTPDAQGYWELSLPYIVMNDGPPRIETYTRARDPKLGSPHE